ncbi:MAG: DinB family protein [Hyphomicrobiales bacterium]
MTPELAAVIQELDAHRERFETFCRSLSEEELNRPVPQSTWLVRDFIAHLGTIDRPVAEMFRSVHEGKDPGMRTGDGQRFDVDHWNDRQVAERRALSIDELFAEAARTRAELHRDLAALTGKDLDAAMKFGGDSKRPPAAIKLIRYLQGWCKHDPIHVADMIRALPERQPEVADWLNDPVIAGYQAVMNRA